MTATDEELCRAFLSGKEQAFDQLVLRHQSRIFSLCFRMLGDAEDADECAQDAFVKVHAALPKFEFRAKFSTWLYRIAMNVCKNRLSSAAFRKKKSEISLATGAGEKDLEIRDEGQAARAETKELGELIQQGLGELSEQDRSLITLCDLENLSYEEIAETLSLELGTVKSRIFRTRERFRIILEKLMGETPLDKRT